MQVDKSYTHFAIRKTDNRVLTGWDYKGLDSIEVKHWSSIDLKDMDYKLKDVKVLSVKSLEKLGVNPFDWSFWVK